MNGPRYILLAIALIIASSCASSGSKVVKDEAINVPAQDEPASEGGTAEEGAAEEEGPVIEDGPAAEDEIEEVADARSGADLEGSTAQGELDKEVIQSVALQHHGEIRRCYEQSLAHDPDLVGYIVVSWAVASDGSVQSVVIMETTMDNLELEDCLTENIRGWVFPEPRGDGIVRVVYPIVFSH